RWTERRAYRHPSGCFALQRTMAPRSRCQAPRARSRNRGVTNELAVRLRASIACLGRCQRTPGARAVRIEVVQAEREVSTRGAPAVPDLGTTLAAQASARRRRPRAARGGERRSRARLGRRRRGGCRAGPAVVRLLANVSDCLDPRKEQAFWAEFSPELT